MQVSVVSTSEYGARMNELASAMRLAMLRAANETAKATQDRGRADIASAGNFGPAWTEGFKSEVSQDNGTVTVSTTMSGKRAGAWRVFQEGRTMQGRPLLWIPLSWTDAPKSWRRFPGQLVQVEREGGKAPLLVTQDEGVPMYHGQTSVTIPKKFHLIEIAEEEGRNMRDRYTEEFRKIKGSG